MLADSSNDYEEKKEGQKTIFYELRDSPILSKEEKSFNRLLDEGLLLVAAGKISVFQAYAFCKE